MAVGGRAIPSEEGKAESFAGEVATRILDVDPSLCDDVDVDDHDDIEEDPVGDDDPV